MSVSIVGQDLLPSQPDEVAHERCKSHNDHHNNSSVHMQKCFNNFDAFVSSLIDV